MMKKGTKIFRRLVHMGWLPLLVLVLSACTGPAERIWLKASGWNRACLVGDTSVVDPVSIALNDAGDIYLFLMSGDRDVAYPRVVALNRGAEVVWDRSYEVELKRPDQSRIFWDGQVLQLFWISGQGLYNAPLESATGDLLDMPTLLSGEVKVRSYDVAEDAGGLMAIWYAGAKGNPGLYALPPGDPAGEATVVDTLGIRPDLQYDEAGTLHAIWTRYPSDDNHPQVFYAAYQDGLYVSGQETGVLELRAGATTIFGPWLGLDRQRVYLLWTAIPRSGPKTGSASTRYVHFPRAQPASVSSVRQLLIPYTYRLEYQVPPQGGLEAGPRVLLESEPYGANAYITELAVDPALAPELAIAFHTQLEYLRHKEQGQVSTVFFQNGAPVAYQQISFTPASSGFPAILSNEAGQLYITWLESGALSGYNVYFASTAPDIRGALSGITWDDFGRLSAETLFGLLGGAVLLPLAMVWVLVPMIVLGLTSVIRRKDDSLTNLGVIVSLTLALVTFWVSKLALMPGMSEYVPFSAWLPFLPPALNLPLRLGVPLLIAGLALVTAWRHTYGSDRPATFFFLLIYAAVDSALTMAVYGTIFYGAY